MQIYESKAKHKRSKQLLKYILVNLEKNFHKRRRVKPGTSTDNVTVAEFKAELQMTEETDAINQSPQNSTEITEDSEQQLPKKNITRSF